MFKKFLILAVSLFVVLFIASCGQSTTEATTNTTTQSTVTTTAIDTTTEAQTTIQLVTLPDLTGLSKSQIKTALENLSLVSVFQYETNTDVNEDTFLRYGDSLSDGDEVNVNSEITIILATPRLVLPDLEGMTQADIITALFSANINFQVEVVNDNEVADQTFSSYGDGLKAGDLIPSSFTVTVNIAFNSPRLPDLTGMPKEQIIKELEDDNIIYQFAYVTDDNYAEDTFAGYQDMNIGDFYIDGTVTINLYKNTFTSNPESLFISKYIDGGDQTSDQAIEIYNPTDQTIDLSDYYLAIFLNGAFTESYSISFGDTSLAAGSTYVIANTNANAQILAKADQTSDDLIFDGNDTIQICYSNGTYIDTIYNLGNKNYVMDNEIFVRNENTVKGTRIFKLNEWNAYVPDYDEIIGTFPLPVSYEMPFTFIDRPWNDPLGGMDSVTLTGVADGDTAYFSPGFLDDQRVRFLGVDTPETYPRVDPWGPEAKAYTKHILESAIGYYIQSDPDMGLYGNYGRSLGLVWVNLGTETLDIDILSSTGTVMRTEHLSGWILLNYHLILNGYSFNYYGTDTDLTFDHRYIYRWFEDAEKFASDNGLGVHEQ